MTAIIGIRGENACFLATDTRRRNHVTDKISKVKKLHKWSEQLIFVQGGAGTGAADLVVSALFANKNVIGESLEDVEEFIVNNAPKLVAPAQVNWNKNGKTMPPTYIILCSCDKTTGIGHHVCIDLTTGDIKFDCKDLGPYMTGSDTPQIMEVVSEKVKEQLPSTKGLLEFDKMAVEAVSELESLAPQNIGGPVNLGYVKLNSEGNFEAVIVSDVSIEQIPNLRFAVNI